MSRLPLAPLLLLAAACGSTPDGTLAAARTAMVAFQDALRRGDADACRSLLTQESAPVLAEMPWERVARQPALEIGAARHEAGAVHVEVRDPAHGGRASAFVVVREYGRHVVDLVATAALHSEVVAVEASADAFVPRPLSPADHDRIRHHELAQPPR